MSEPFIAEIKIVGFNFPPRGWAQCDGQILPISQNQSLYSLLGTTYGGDGRTNFQLPDLRGRAPRGFGNGGAAGNVSLGQRGGVETVALTTQQMPAHRHMRGSGDQATETSPVENTPASRPRRGVRAYAPASDLTALSGGPPSVGNGTSHQNMQPSMVVNIVIALQGLFPPRN